MHVRVSLMVWIWVASMFVTQGAQAANGRTSGTFNVSSTGAFTYRIPIWMPPGPNGIQPNLALTYNSQSGDGTMGPGWSLSGLSAITRCTKTYAQDGTAQAVALVATDGFCLDGKRLRLTSGTYGAAGSTYQTEIADFSQITANGSATGGPSYFIVQGKDGLTYEYGYEAGSKVIATGTINTISRWLLNKVSDRSGNKYNIYYGQGEDESWGIGIPLQLSYTPSSTGSYSYNYSVNFNYTLANSASTESGYIAGTAVQNTNLLNSITIKSGAAVIRHYQMTYIASPTTSHSRLTEVKECVDSTMADCLSPTVISYQNGTSGLSSSSASVTGTTQRVYGAYDFNGDGRSDLVYAQSSLIYVAMASGSGYATPINTGIAYGGLVYFRDFLGNGKTGIFALQSGTWNYLSWNGSSFSSSAVITDPGSGMYHSMLADIDGDGRPDFVYSQGDYIKVRINTSTGSSPSLSSSALDLMYWSSGNHGYPAGFIWGFANPSPAHDIDRKGIPDINGDSREDLVLTWQGTYVDAYGDYNSVDDGHPLLTGGTSTAPTLTLVTNMFGGELDYDQFDGFQHMYQYGHFNNDNCSDLVSGGYLVITACNGQAASSVYIDGSVTLDVFDWNGDGLDDVLINNAWTVGVRVFSGTSFGSTISTSIPVVRFINIDQDGDGLDDLASVSNSHAVSFSLHNSVGARPDLAISIKDGYDVEVQPSYASIAKNYYTKYTDGSYPNKDYISPLYVVGQVTATDGVGGTYSNSYWYSGGWLDIQRRSFAGFARIKTSDSRNGFDTFEYFRRDFPYTGMLYQQDVFQNNGTTLISHTVKTPAVTTLDSAAYNQRYFPYVASSTTDIYEIGGTKNAALITQSTASFTYDGYGNVSSSTTTVTDKDNGAPASPTYNQTWTTAITNTFSTDPARVANWCLGLPTQTQVVKSSTIAGETALTRTSAYTPDYINCRISQQIVEPLSAAYKVTTDYLYDAFGNVNSQTVTGVNMTARTTLANWGTTGQFPENTTNAEGHYTQAGYNYNLGVQTSQTDPNGLITSWTYDTFGRKLTEVRPDGTSTAYSYNDCTMVSGGCQNGDPAGSTSINKMVVITTLKNTAGTAMRDDWTYLDQFDRTIVTKTKTLPMASGSTYSRKGIQYDALGRVYRQTAPCDASSCTVYWTTNTYDAVGRLTAQSRPISATNSTLQTTTMAYQGMTTITTDPQSKTTTKVNDPNGWLRQSKDHNGYYQAFTYDAFGSLKAVTDSASNVLFSANYAYGIGAFQTQTTDMDLGTWNYTPDALGEVTGYTDAKGSAFTMTYDKLSRPLTRFVSGEGTTTWTWGNTAANYNIGKLQSVASLGYTENSYYDSKSRLAVKSIVTDTTYRYDYTYEATTGLLSTIVYPYSTLSYRLNVQYIYQSGLLQKVRNYGTSALYWQANTMNPLGEITKETLGNGIVTNRSFDGVTGWLNSIQAGVGGGTGVQNESYLFDKVGNVTQRQNNTLGLTESFYYDNLYRLDYSQLNSVTNLDMTYDQLGRITNRTDVASNATWTYDATKKHAVTQVGSSSYTYSYDANGNAITRNGYGITWSKYNYPTVINSPSENITLSYDANNQRWKQVYVNGATTETTMYAGGLFEKVTTGGVIDYRHYIYAGNELIGVLSRSGTSATLRYTLSDHQGSMDKITDSSGGVTVSENFSAFGARRNPSTWSGSPTSTDLTTINGISRQGYTGQDALGNLGLNHMNGRVQDAITGRFLSADPYITEPWNTQNYNRYSYVYNNPMSFTDPTGFDCNDQNSPHIGQCTDFGGSSGGGSGGNSSRDPPYWLEHYFSSDGTENWIFHRFYFEDLSRGFLAASSTTSNNGMTHSPIVVPISDTLVVGPQTQKDPCGTGSQIDTSHPDLGLVGNTIRNQLDNDFAKDLFENYWNGSGDVQLSSEQFSSISHAAEHLTPAYTSHITTSYRSVLTRNTYSFYGTEFANSIGSGMVFMNQAGKSVGFYDRFNLDSKDWGQRPYWKEALVRAAAAAARNHGAKPFNASYGSCRVPK